MMGKKKTFYGIVKGRSIPGTLIFDPECKLLYSNKEAFEMVPELQRIPIGRREKGICDGIYDICNQLKEKKKTRKDVPGKNLAYGVLNHGSGNKYSIQAFFVGNPEDKKPTHIMVLIEKLIEKHNIDFEKAKGNFKLSTREMEVLRLICDGLPNKSISNKLFISEYTVKDHTKNILRKMGANSRNQIISSLK